MEMKFLIVLCAIFLTSISALAENINVFCPSKDFVKVTEPGSWAPYKYTATTPINIPQLNDQLVLIGEGTAPKATIMQAATWTDRTLNCLYNQGLDVMVLTSVSLDPYVEKCSFPGGGPECISSDPLACPMTCEKPKLG